MTKKAIKSVIEMLCEISVFAYTAALAVVKASAGWVKDIINYI